MRWYRSAIWVEKLWKPYCASYCHNKYRLKHGVCMADEKAMYRQRYQYRDQYYEEH